MALLTINHYINQANNFIEDIEDTRRSYYVFAGRSQPWTDDNDPPEANDSITQIQQTVYDDLLFGKLVRSTDVKHMIPRYNWTNNTSYAEYSQDDPDLYSKQFFVMTDQYEVYKCVFNNYGANSTVKPSLTTTSGTFKTADGYIWKYMYSIDASSNTKFTTSSYIPVVANTAVQGNAIPGTIEAIKIANGGSGYNVYETGLISNFTDKFTIQLPANSSPYDNYYVKSSIYLKSGFGGGQIREIASSSGSAKTVRVSSSDPFNTFKRLDLTNVNGTVEVGYEVQQPIDYINYLYPVGFFNAGETVVQSDTGIAGKVLSYNASAIQIGRNNTSTPFTLNKILVSTVSAGTLKSGNLSITAASPYANSTNTAQTAFTTDYSVGNYIRVGTNANNNIRRITAVNTTVITVDSNFDSSNAATVHYLVTNALEPTSILASQANGVITDVNINSINLVVTDPSVPGTFFTVGEKLELVNSANTSQGANAIVAYANGTDVFLTSVTDPASNFSNTYFWANNFYVRGQSSLVRYVLDSTSSNPNITIRDFSATEFVLGQPVKFIFESASTGNASLIGTTIYPNSSTAYEIGPTISISGDGSNASAIGVVNTSIGSGNNIVSVSMIDNGEDYTYANISIYANGTYGSGATATPLISPINGHGSDVISELGSRYVGVDVIFDNASTEGYYFPIYGTYRRVGIIQDPLINDVRVTLTDFDRVNLTLNASSYTIGPNSSWTPGEVVVQSTSNAAGVVVSGNSTHLQLKSVKGTFANNHRVSAYYSNTYANVVYGNVIYFETGSNTTTLLQVTSGASAIITSKYSNTSIQLSNVIGQFSSSDTLYDAASNAYAVVDTIYTANGTKDQTSTLGLRFNQTERISLTSIAGSFVNNEIIIQDNTLASGRVISSTDDIDLEISGLSGSVFSIGQTVSDETSNANGFVLFANSTYVKLTGVSQLLSFASGHTINNGVSSTATISSVIPVLVVNDVDGYYRFLAQPNNIVGQTSGATGQCNSYSLITYPELVRETGKVIYMENIEPVTRSASTKEEFKLVIKF